MDDTHDEVDDMNLEGQTWHVEAVADDQPDGEPFWLTHTGKIRALCALAAMVFVSDLTIYRGEGFTGIAVFLLAAPILFMVARPWSIFGIATLICGTTLLFLATRLIWCGSLLTVVCGMGILGAFAVSLNGRKPFVLQTMIFGGMTLPYGAQVLGQLGHGTRAVVTHEPTAQRAGWLSIIVPIFAVAAFGLMFVFANPDLAEFISGRLAPWIKAFGDWVRSFRPTEIIFWIVVLWLTAGLIRPLLPITDDDETAELVDPGEQTESTLYATGRNTLVTLILLFVVYLMFEFRTLWFREFPKGFYYAGYAHQGAAWLTAALALATLTLSLMFRGSMLNDPREPRLRQMAWIWSGLNLLLTASVYNRLAIYIDFNGMTRMRTIGLLGTTTVVAGFLLTLWKIHRNKRFLWLVRRDLWAVAIAVIVYAVIPVDWLIHTYNVRQVMAGDLAPVVQITEHPISAEGLLTLEPLLECDDPIIQRGIAAMLEIKSRSRQAGSSQEGRTASKRNQGDTQHWTSRQWSDEVLHERLKIGRPRRLELISPTEIDTRHAFQEFKDYAYQWY